MQSRAKEYLPSFSNIRWVLSNGETLSGVESASVDFVFSYLVLQHMPTKEVVFNSIQEMMRVLHPGGVFLFQFNGSEQPTMNWKGRAISRIIDGIASVGLRDASRRIASVAGIDPEMVGKTGAVSLLLPPVADAVRSGAVHHADAGTPAWCCGNKQPGHMRDHSWMNYLKCTTLPHAWSATGGCSRWPRAH
jgi:SAM-dependent methyltransferase